MITIEQTVKSVETTAKDSLNRYLDEQCNEVEEKEFFTLEMQEKTLDVFINYPHYFFESFTRNERPQGAGCILELKKLKKFEKCQYRIIVKPNATSEMIQAALEMLVLPF
jgi:hypothetical protein